MSSYFLKWSKNTKIINPRVSRTDNGKTMTLWKCAICGSKIQDLLKEEVSEILSNLGLK